MSVSTLKAHILSNPDCTSLLSRGDHVAIATLYNVVREDVTITLSSMEKSSFLKSLLPAIIILSTKEAAIQSKWDRILDVIYAVPFVHVSDPIIQSLCDLAVSDGLLSSEGRLLIGKRAGSLAESFLGENVVLNAEQVAGVLR